jgi:hypothetical protein
MNVKFLSTLYQPDEKERERLNNLQVELSIVQTELSYIFRDLHPYEKMFRKQVFHNKFRDRSIKLVKSTQEL